MKLGMLLMAGWLSTAAASAGISVISLGTGAPEMTLGPYTLLPFGPDPRPLFANETEITPSSGLPVDGALSFGAPVNHRRVGEGWRSWSHGYQGDVYWSNGATTLDMNLPDFTVALLFYVEPNPFETFDVIVMAHDGTTISTPVTGLAGANGFGVYSDGEPILSVRVSSEVDFAVAFSGIHTKIPEPATLTLLASAGLALCRRRSV